MTFKSESKDKRVGARPAGFGVMTVATVDPVVAATAIEGVVTGPTF